ncbi:MAG: hypothetical protein WDA27_12230 [Actinomycetota bacterium]
MASEMNRRRNMKSSQKHSEYIGALIPDECRMMLVSMDPERPWEAFRQMRRLLRKEKKAAEALVGLFESPVPIDLQADVIPLASRRRAG